MPISNASWRAFARHQGRARNSLADKRGMTNAGNRLIVDEVEALTAHCERLVRALRKADKKKPKQVKALQDLLYIASVRLANANAALAAGKRYKGN